MCLCIFVYMFMCMCVYVFMYLCIYLFCMYHVHSKYMSSVPESELRTWERIFVQQQQAHWKYTDEKLLGWEKYIDFRQFVQKIFSIVPSLQKFVKKNGKEGVTKLLAQFERFLQSIPVYGSIVQNETLDSIQLVSQLNKWSIPRGKVNKDEIPQECAIREVLEETGINIAPYLIDTNYLVYHNKLLNSYITSYFIIGVPITINRNKKINAEVDRVEWIPLQDIIDKRLTLTFSTSIILFLFYYWLATFHEIMNKNSFTTIDMTILRKLLRKSGMKKKYTVRKEQERVVPLVQEIPLYRIFSNTLPDLNDTVTSEYISQMTLLYTYNIRLREKLQQILYQTPNHSILNAERFKQRAIRRKSTYQVQLYANFLRACNTNLSNVSSSDIDLLTDEVQSCRLSLDTEENVIKQNQPIKTSSNDDTVDQLFESVVLLDIDQLWGDRPPDIFQYDCDILTMDNVFGTSQSPIIDAKQQDDIDIKSISQDTSFDEKDIIKSTKELYSTIVKQSITNPSTTTNVIVPSSIQDTTYTSFQPVISEQNTISTSTTIPFIEPVNTINCWDKPLVLSQTATNISSTSIYNRKSSKLRAIKASIINGTKSPKHISRSTASTTR